MSVNEDGQQRAGRAGTAALAFGALGIVYGDIGTSPIYAIRETFDHAGLDATTQSAYGVASVVFWALTIVISVKYLALVMRADKVGAQTVLAGIVQMVAQAHEIINGRLARFAAQAESRVR